MSVCPTCKKPNCGNWAACARRGAANEMLVHTSAVVWYGIGVAETLFQTGMRSRNPAFLLMLAMDGPEGVRRGLFIAALRKLDAVARKEER